jgi:hypothetical protein
MTLPSSFGGAAFEAPQPATTRTSRSSDASRAAMPTG